MGESNQCGHCGSKATVFVSFVVKGKAKSQAFCEEHARQLGLLDSLGYSLLEEQEDAMAEALAVHSPRCPTCGFSQREFERRGRFGCPDCYTAFHDLVEPMLKRMHKGTRHTGKVPRAAFSPEIVDRRLRELDRELEEAVEAERYEDAAEIRDQMTELRTHLPEAHSKGA